MAILKDDGQIQTVEAITASIILLSIIALVVEATSVTPLTSSFTNQHVKLELQNIGSDILAAQDGTPYSPTPPDPNSVYSSQLKYSVVKWLKDTQGRDWFACSDTVNYKSLRDPSGWQDPNNPPLNTPLARTLSLVLLQKSGISYNVDIRYPDNDGNIMNTKMIWNGDPSDNSVTVSRVIALRDDDLDANADYTYVVPDVGPTTDLHNVVEVRLTMWVM